jgi:hypothetical protein
VGTSSPLVTLEGHTKGINCIEYCSIDDSSDRFDLAWGGCVVKIGVCYVFNYQINLSLGLLILLPSCRQPKRLKESPKRPKTRHAV